VVKKNGLVAVLAWAVLALALLPGPGAAGQDFTAEHAETAEDRLQFLGALGALSGELDKVTLAGQPPTWGFPINLSRTPGASRGPRVAVDGAGDVHVVWSEDVGGNLEVFHRRWQQEAQVWTPPVSLSASPWPDWGPELWRAPDGRLHLAWCRGYTALGGAPHDATEVLHRTWNGTAWSPAEVVYRNGEAYVPGGYGLTFAQDAQGRLYLFLSFGFAFTYTVNQGAGWEPLAAWNQSMGVTQAATDGLGRLHLVGYGPNSSQTGYDQYFYDAYYIRYDEAPSRLTTRNGGRDGASDGTSWTTAFNVTGTDGIAHDQALAIDAAGNVHVVWADTGSPYSSESQGSAVYERVLSGESWGANTLVTTPNRDQAVEDVALARDELGQLHLAWTEGVFAPNTWEAVNLTVRYRQNAGTGWSPETVVNPEGGGHSLNVDLAVGGSYAYAVWEEGPALGQEVFGSSTDPAIRPTPLFGLFLPVVYQHYTP
jgi:hypothetical protein